MGVAAVALLSLPSCEAADQRARTIVASFYPLAYAAGRIAGPSWEVIDLTPPGSEAHDVELSLDDREAIGRADLLLYLGMNGFQPQVEAAIADTGGVVRGVDDDLRDPHLWLSPRTYLDRIARFVLEALTGYAGDDDDRRYRRRFEALSEDLNRLDEAYTTELSQCRYRTMIVSHEAFSYLAEDYDLRQFGLAGVDPEGEPTFDRIEEALSLIEGGRAGAVLYEPSEEGQRTAEDIARDAGVPALPLSPLESRPPEGDYVSVMEDNLRSLREGLGCR